MAINPDHIWTAREFGIRHEFAPAVPGGDHRYPMDGLWRGFWGAAGGDHDYFRGSDKPLDGEGQQQGHGVSGDSGRVDRSSGGGTTEDLINEFRDYDAQKRTSLATETTGKVDMLDRFLHWLQSTFWFVRKEAYPEFDKIMFEAREFAKTPDATNIPLVIHPLRRSWADRVLTGEEEE